MADRWVAECAPCTWGTFHETQDEAIEAVDRHIEALHRKTPAAQRSAERIGHVQFRTVTESDWGTADVPRIDNTLPEAPPAPDNTPPAEPPNVINPLPAKKGSWSSGKK